MIAIMVSITSPLISSVPNTGGWLSLAISIVAFIFSVILVYDAGRTIYAAFESSIQALIDRIVAHTSNKREEEKR
jgi:acid phosphatase family membrane protein YuiD